MLTEFQLPENPVGVAEPESVLGGSPTININEFHFTVISNERISVATLINETGV